MILVDGRKHVKETTLTVVLSEDICLRCQWSHSSSPSIDLKGNWRCRLTQMQLPTLQIPN